jgi:hypothetical protein
MGEGDSAYLVVKPGQDIGRVESDEGITDDSGHLVDAAGMGPVRVVNRSKSQSLSLEEEPVNAPINSEAIDQLHLALQGSQHHVGRIQAMDEVGWERRSLFHEFTVAGALGSEM